MSPNDLGYASSIPMTLLEPLEDMATITTDLSQHCALPNALLEVSRARGVVPTPCFTMDQLSHFYQSAAERIERESGDVNKSKQVLKCGIENQVSEQLPAQMQQLMTFESYLSAGTAFWNFDSTAFFKLTVQERIERILAPVGMDEVLQQVATVLTQLIKKLSCEEKNAFRQILLQYTLQRKARLFEEIISLECMSSEFFEATSAGFEELITTTISTIESVDKIIDWDAVYEALETLSRQGSLQQSVSQERQACLETAMEDAHLGSLVEKHGRCVRYSELKNLSVADGQRLLKSMHGHAMRSGKRWSDAQWDELLSDLMTVALGVARLTKTDVDIQSVQLEYFQTLLRASKFSLAGSYMESNLDLEVAEEIAWKTGRELLCAITDLDNTASIEDTKRCFDLFPSSQRARKEANKLKALLSVRSSFGLILLPVELEQFQAQTELIERILSSSEKHYKKSQVFKNICSHLQFSDEDFFETWKMLGSMAIQHGDLHKAKELLHDLQERNLTQSWTLALDIVTEDRNQQYLSSKEQKELWSFIITNCNCQLQECIAQMKESFEDDTTIGASYDMEAFPCCDDVYFYFADEAHRNQMQQREGSFVEQKRDVYGFVHGALMSVNNKNNESAAFLRDVLESSPVEIADKLRQCPQYLKEGIQQDQLSEAFEHRIISLKQGDRLQTSCQRIQAILPGLDSEKFCGGSETEYRKQIIFELARYAAELLYVQERRDMQTRESTRSWEETLSVCFEQGEEFGVDAWSLHCHFVRSICSLVDGKFRSLEKAVIASEVVLVKKKDQYLKQVLESCWSAINNSFGVAFVLRIVVRCLDVNDPKCSAVLALLNEYASRITAMNDVCQDFDFRLPVRALLSTLVRQSCGFDLDWRPEMSELQALYSCLDETNYDSFDEMYQSLTQAGSLKDVQPDLLSSSYVLVCFFVKQTLSNSWTNQFQERPFWRKFVSALPAEDLSRLIDFAIFRNADNLLEAMASLSQATKEEIQSWCAQDAGHEQRKVFILFLEEAIERFSVEESYTQSVDVWKTELKRLRRLHAAQNLSGIGVHVSEDDFVVSVKNVVKQLVLEGNVYASVFEAIKNFAEQSGEDNSSDTLYQWIADALLNLTAEVLGNDFEQLKKIFSCLEASEDSLEIRDLQEKIWDKTLSLTKRHRPAKQIVEAMVSVLRKDIWQERCWNIKSEDKWILFSWTVFLRLEQLPEIKQTLELDPDSFSSSENVQRILNCVLSIKTPTSLVCLLLDALSTERSILSNEVNANYFCDFYSKSFHFALERQDPESVLRYLCHSRTKEEKNKHPILEEHAAMRLMSVFNQTSEILALCTGLLLPFPSVRQEAFNALDAVEGDENVLALLVHLKCGVKIGSLSMGALWLANIIQQCPPHHHVAQRWHALVDRESNANALTLPQPVEESVEAVSLSASVDGWDIDDDLAFGETDPGTQQENETAPSQSDGWSDMDELETALQSAAQCTGARLSTTALLTICLFPCR